MLQKKEQNKNLQDQINEEEICNLFKKKFRVMIVKMIQSLRNGMMAWTGKIQEMLNKGIKKTKEQINGVHNNWKEKYPGRNQQQNNWDRRMNILEMEDRMMERIAKE